MQKLGSSPCKLAGKTKHRKLSPKTVYLTRMLNIFKVLSTVLDQKYKKE